MFSSGQKSSVAQTCNLLSQYLKENGRFADIISLGMIPKIDAEKGVETARMQPGTMMNLLPNPENSSENSRQNNIKAADIFSDIPNFGSPNTMNDAMLEDGSSQMTIFYAGKLLVFNDFPAEKVKEIVAIASEGSSNTSNSGFLPPPAMDKVNSSRAVTPDLNGATTSDNDNNNNIPTPVPFHQRSQAVPIARRASLRRFFEKRKDRVTASAPYQVKTPPSSSMAATSPEPEDQSKFPWLELEAQSSKLLDLKL